MYSLPRLFFLTNIGLISFLRAQEGDVDDCALPCIANVNGTSCSPSQWTCLCANDAWIERVNGCTRASCNATDQQDTFAAVAQICAIFSIPVTVGPEATVSVLTSDPLFSTVAIPSASSLPPVLTSTTASVAPSASAPASSSLSRSSPATASLGASTPSSGSASATTALPPTGTTSHIAAASSSSGCGANQINLSPLVILAGALGLVNLGDLASRAYLSIDDTTTESTPVNRPFSSSRAPGKPPVSNAPRADTAPSILTPPPPTAPAPPVIDLIRPHRAGERTSLLQGLLAARQRTKAALRRDARTTTARVLNPINYVPRPTPIRVQSRPQPSYRRRLSLSTGGAPGEVHTLLTLPEQRRSRQPSPTSPAQAALEHSPHLTPESGDCARIGLPSHQQRGRRDEAALPLRTGLMRDAEKKAPHGVQEPEQVHLPASRPATLDVEAQQGPSVLSQSYGVNPLDQPLHPPRRVSSLRSLRRAQSGTSLHSSAYARTNADGPLPPFAPSQEAVGQPHNEGPEGSVADELAWGPAHPCFPHPNSHVPLNSREYASTRIIRIRRDWMVAGDLAPTFSNIYPEILDPLMQEQEFRYVIEHINNTLSQAYDPFSAWNWIDGLLGLATGWLWEDFRPTGIKAQLKALEEWLQDWNHTVGARDGVKIMPLRRTGYMNLDIQIPDPQVRVVDEADAEVEAEAEGETGHG